MEIASNFLGAHQALPEPAPGLCNLQRLNGLILDLYREHTDSRLGWWQTLDFLREFFGSSQAVLIARRVNGPVMEAIICASEPCGKFERDYLDSFHAHDPLAILPPGTACSHRDVLSEQRWVDSVFYRKFLAPMNVRQVLGADVLAANDICFSLRLCRPPDRHIFSSLEKEAFQLLLVHIRQAAELTIKRCGLSASDRVVSELVDRMHLGCVVLDQHGMTLQTNNTAKELIGQNRGLLLSGKRLRAENFRENEKFQQIVATALQAHRQAKIIAHSLKVCRLHRQDKGLGITIRSLPASDAVSGDRQPAVAVVFRDLQGDIDFSKSAIRDIFSLTACETRVAVALGRGLSIDEAAEELSVTRNTIRTHLSALFRKTGTTRQVELVRVLISNTGFYC